MSTSEQKHRIMLRPSNSLNKSFDNKLCFSVVCFVDFSVKREREREREREDATLELWWSASSGALSWFGLELLFELMLLM